MRNGRPRIERTAAPPIDEQTLQVVERRAAPPAVRHRGRHLRHALLVGDVASLLICFALIDLVVGWSFAAPATTRVLTYGVLGLGLLALLACCGLYGRDEVGADHTTPDDLPTLFQAATVGGFAACGATWAVGRSDELVPLVLLGWLLLVLLLPLGRGVARTLARRDQRYLQRILIIGAGDVGQLVARKLGQHPEYGFDLVGFVDDHPKHPAGDIADVPVLGGIADVSRLVRDHGVERVLVAFSGGPHGEILDVVRALKDLDVQVAIVPRLFEVVGPNVSITTIQGLPMVVLPPLRVSRLSLAVKRVMDVCLSGLGLLVAAPLFAAIAVAIRLEGPGPLLYSGERVGAGGRRFGQLKFRTMRTEFCSGPRYGGDEAAAAFARLLASDPALAEEFARTQKLENDPRVTRIGGLLRRTSLDELPQLWNVLRGDLSLVGPRPITEEEMHERYRPRILDPAEGDSFLIGYWDSPGLRPGLTGYWQISGRSKMSFDERVRLDTAYLTSWSLGLDVEILAKTLRALVASRGAY